MYIFYPFPFISQVNVKSLVPGEDGTVDMVLRLNLQDLLSSIESSVFNNGEATSNAIPADPGFAYENADFCKSHTNLRYIIYVHTSPANVERRENLRKTWANPDLFMDGRTKVVFMLGLAEDAKSKEIIQNEIATYGDIVQGDFIDEYNNLTTKGIFGLKWLTYHCANAEYAIKADDDAFVNPFKLMRLLNRYHDQKRLVACPLWKDHSMPILRDPKKCMKWCVKYNEFPGKNYFPKYCAGLSFTLSRDIIPDMYHAAASTPFFWIDDVYVTGLLLGKTKNVEYIDLLKNFTLKEKLAVEQYTNYTLEETFYFSHIRQAENMDVMWRATLQRLPGEELYELSPSVYEYDRSLVSKVDAYKERLSRRRPAR